MVSGNCWYILSILYFFTSKPNFCNCNCALQMGPCFHPRVTECSCPCRVRPPDLPKKTKPKNGREIFPNTHSPREQQRTSRYQASLPINAKQSTRALCFMSRKTVPPLRSRLSYKYPPARATSESYCQYLIVGRKLYNCRWERREARPPARLCFCLRMCTDGRGSICAHAPYESSLAWVLWWVVSEKFLSLGFEVVLRGTWLGFWSCTWCIVVGSALTDG